MALGLKTLFMILAILALVVGVVLGLVLHDLIAAGVCALYAIAFLNAGAQSA